MLARMTHTSRRALHGERGCRKLRCLSTPSHRSCTGRDSGTSTAHICKPKCRLLRRNPEHFRLLGPLAISPTLRRRVEGNDRAVTPTRRKGLLRGRRQLQRAGSPQRGAVSQCGEVAQPTCVMVHGFNQSI